MVQTTYGGTVALKAQDFQLLEFYKGMLAGGDDKAKARNKTVSEAAARLRVLLRTLHAKDCDRLDSECPRDAAQVLFTMARRSYVAALTFTNPKDRFAQDFDLAYAFCAWAWGHRPDLGLPRAPLTGPVPAAVMVRRWQLSWLFGSKEKGMGGDWLRQWRLWQEEQGVAVVDLDLVTDVDPQLAEALTQGGWDAGY